MLFFESNRLGGFHRLRLLGNRDDCGALHFHNLLVFEPANWRWRGASTRYIFWWEWVDSNHLSRKTTDLQSAPALQLRRTPRTLFSPIFTQQTKTARLRFATPRH